MNATELLMRRRNVKAFIVADPVLITVARPQEPIKSAAGGFIKQPNTTLAPQQARIVQSKRRYNNGLVNAEAGDIPHTDYLLIAVHTQNFLPEDMFTWQGEHYKITGRSLLRQESILCSIDLLGSPNRNG